MTRHEKEIEIRWSDLDVFGHVNHVVFLTYLEEARDEWLGGLLERPDEVWGYVVAHVAINYRRELSLSDDIVVARCALERIGTSSLHTREEITTREGAQAASAEAVLVARDPDTGRSRPLTDAERTLLARDLPAEPGPSLRPRPRGQPC